MTDEEMDTPRRMATIRGATEYCGLGKVTIYKLASIHSGLLRKYGRRTLVELRVLDKILDALPDAKIKIKIADRFVDRNR